MCFDLLCFEMCVSSADSTIPEVPLTREEEVDLTLLKNDSGVESALLYAKAWSKYIKDLLAWMEKRLALGETLTVHCVAKQGYCIRTLSKMLWERMWWLITSEQQYKMHPILCCRAIKKKSELSGNLTQGDWSNILQMEPSFIISLLTANWG